MLGTWFHAMQLSTTFIPSRNFVYLLLYSAVHRGNVLKSKQGPTFIASLIDFGIDTLELIFTLFSPFYDISSPKTSIFNDFCLKNLPDRLERAYLDGD